MSPWEIQKKVFKLCVFVSFISKINQKSKKKKNPFKKENNNPEAPFKKKSFF